MSISVTQIGHFPNIAGGAFDEGVAEIVTYDPSTQRLYQVNGRDQTIDVLDVSANGAPTLHSRIYSGPVNSVAVSNGLVAAAVQSEDPLSNGKVILFTTDGSFVAQFEVGVLPDSLAFSPDGTKIVVANEGEFVEEGDPQGLISIIDLSEGAAAAKVTHVDFTAFDGQEDELRQAGVRLLGETVSQSIEPEYVTIDADGKRAMVTLQENNAVAMIDLENGRLVDIIPVGLKDHSAPGNGLDASDRDGGINIANWPIVGMYMPDGIASFEIDGKTYYAIANEGDARGEEVRIKDLELDPGLYPNAEEIQQDENIGRLEASSIDGDWDGDGKIDLIHVYGGRSFSILDEDGNMVFDSGDAFEQIIAEQFPEQFNSGHDDNDSFDSRSDSKGSEPEGVTIGKIGDQTYAFIGLERQSGVMMYDVSNPLSPSFVKFISNRDFTVDAESPEAGDLGPEGILFIPAEDSPTGEALLVTGNEVSGTTSVYELRDTETPPEEENFTLQILHASDWEGGVAAIDRAGNFAAIVDYLEDQEENSITLSSGDGWIPSPFYIAGGDPAMAETYNAVYNQLFGLSGNEAYAALTAAAGRADITIQNIIGVQAAAFGNHEFDAGTGPIRDIIGDAPGGTAGLADDAWVGAMFPYLSSNLNFSGDSNLSGLYTDEIRDAASFATDPSKAIAPSTIITENGEKIAVIGATTQMLPVISSPGGVSVDGGTGDDMALLAAQINAEVERLKEANPDLNKIIVTSHLQQIALEKELAPLLDDVDVIVAGGSHSLLADETDELRPGDTADDTYPIITQDKNGNPLVIVNTDSEYSYVGRLVVEFDADGHLVLESLDPEVNGAYATTDETVEELWGSLEDAYAPGTKADLVDQVINGADTDGDGDADTDGIADIIIEQDGNIFGRTSVYLEGRRGEVRTEETNLGNLTADANLAEARKVDAEVVVSIKNGGGIRDSIGTITSEGGNAETRPPAANPEAGKSDGEISQLDIVNSLRFNNALSIVTITAEGLRAVMEHGFAGVADGATPGAFPQIAGMEVSFDPSRPAGERIQNLAIVDEHGKPVEVIVQDGAIVGDPDRALKVVTLTFLAEGGDGYPFESYMLDRTDLGESNLGDGAATFAEAGTEQDALAEYLAANFSDEAYGEADTPPEEDVRIQNLAVRDDAVLDGLDDGEPEPEPGQIINGTGRNDELEAGSGDDVITGKSGSDLLNGGDGNDKLYGDSQIDRPVLAGLIGLFGGLGGSTDDRLNGGGGDDVLSGGAGSDTFAFDPNFGKDIIVDFQTGQSGFLSRWLDLPSDIIEFDAELFADFDAVMEASEQVGQDVVITYDEGSTLTIANIRLSQLSHDDFRFV
ncbi:choice-of-anchor I family protein [Rhodoligotrophos ferricapiens]|uniref:choice-of-anchor I family protein n=1 Tax=Rhodoligotrophos ferricapiens TaxID=3069264 RepID=UPI00315D2BF7